MTQRNDKSGLVALFDVDNTLLNSRPKIRADIVRAMAALGKVIRPEEADGEWRKLAQRYGISWKEFDEATTKYRKSWQDSLRDGEAPLFDDAVPCFDTLKGAGVELGILTRSTPEYTQTKLEFYGLGKYFQNIEVVPVDARDKIDGATGLVRRIGTKGIRRISFIGDKLEDVQVAEPVQEAFSINSEGIYVNRNNKPISGYGGIVVNGLEEAARYILRENGR